MSSPGAASFNTLSSDASSAPDRHESYSINLPLPVTAPTTMTGSTYLSPSATSKPIYIQPPPSSANAANGNNYNLSNSPYGVPSTPANTPIYTPANTPTQTPGTTPGTTNYHLRPRTATLNFKLLPHLETGLDNKSLDDLISQEERESSYQNSIHDHPIQEFFWVSTDTSDEPEREPELGWKDAYEVMVKAPLRGLAALARWMGRGKPEEMGGMV